MMSADKPVKNMYPTPTARDWKDTMSQEKAIAQMKKRDSPGIGLIVAAQNGGKLNPQFVEWLMNYPTGWTELNVLVMPWFHSKQKRRLRGY